MRAHTFPLGRLVRWQSRRTSAPLVALCIAVMGPGFARPADANARQCAASKIEATGKRADRELNCHASAVGTGAEVGAACLESARAKFETAFQEAEFLGACGAPDDAAAVSARVRTALDEVVGMLGGPGPNACSQQKLEAAGKLAAARSRCVAESVAQGPGFGVSATCLQDAAKNFVKDFTKAERSGACVAGTGDAAAVRVPLDRLLLGSRAAIAPPVSTCVPLTPTSVHGDGFLPNSRLSRIENGTVACMHSETGETARCRFSTDSGRQSGAWLASPEGEFARVGQPIALDGLPSGDYIVAADVTASPASCLEAAGHDTAGLLAEGIELARSCTLEDVNTEWNNYGYKDLNNPAPSPLENWVDGFVCVNNPYHPDGAPSWGDQGFGDGRHCFTGPGAALNDPNGTERDSMGEYYSGERYCHYVALNGYEAPAAKRPAVQTYPAPGAVKPATLILWRPVTHVNIANHTAGDLQVYDSQAGFLTATGAADASGDLPDLGQVSDSVTLGSVTLSPGPGGNTLFVGASGTGAGADWTPLVDGHDIALGYETLQVQTAEPVYALGFDFAEPNETMPDYGGTPVDSTFAVTLYNGIEKVGHFTFNAPDDVAAFVGVSSPLPFNRVTIIDTTLDHDNEYFGRFYTAATRSPGTQKP